MDQHIDILTLLDYALNKVPPGKQSDEIADHLGRCSQCMRLFISQKRFAEDPVLYLDRFFPDPVKAPVIVSAPFPATSGKVFGNLVAGLQQLAEEARNLGKEVEDLVNRQIDSIITGYRLQPVPLRLETGGDQVLLGAGDPGEETSPPPDLAGCRISFLSEEEIDPVNLRFEWTGWFIYVACQTPDYRKLLGKNVLLAGPLPPHLWKSVFQEGFRNAVAKFDLRQGAPAGLTSGTDRPGISPAEFLLILET